jgi:hypothetical protein
MSEHVINEALKQLTTVTWDGNLVSKATRDWLVERGLVQRFDGFNWLTSKGIEHCVTARILPTTCDDANQKTGADLLDDVLTKEAK